MGDVMAINHIVRRPSRGLLGSALVLAAIGLPMPPRATGQTAGAGSPVRPLHYDVKLETVLEHDDGTFLWFHPRVCAIPSDDSISSPTVLMTLQKHLRASDHYSGLYFMLTRDLGRRWSEPELRGELDWVRDGEVNVAVADVTPLWAPVSRRVVAVGAGAL